MCKKIAKRFFDVVPKRGEMLGHLPSEDLGLKRTLRGSYRGLNNSNGALTYTIP